MKLSVVVIGKNEAQNLPALFHSLEPIAAEHEILYVDSASTDDSVEIASAHADRVCELQDSPSLCAAAGRHVGTKEAKGIWVLYLDGDMELTSDFAAWINQMPEAGYGENIAGYIGYYTFVRSDGSQSKNRLHQPKGGKAGYFGGAVLLRRENVLGAGNWNPSVVANEEIDLYNQAAVRLMKKEGVPVNDLHALIMPHVDTYLSEDMLHLSAAGQHACARAVAHAVLAVLQDTALEESGGASP